MVTKGSLEMKRGNINSFFVLVLCLLPYNAFAASLPTTSYSQSIEDDVQEPQDGVVVATTTEALLGSTTYNVTQGDGTNGTFYSTFSFVTPGSPDPGAWFTLADGTGLSIGDIIYFTDVNGGESYTLVSSSYDGYLTVSGAGTALGAYSFFLAAPIGTGNLVLVLFCCVYGIYLYLSHSNRKKVRCNLEMEI